MAPASLPTRASPPAQPGPLRLSVSLVSHFSDPADLAHTLASLAAAVDYARTAGRLGQATLFLIDNSEEAAENQRLRACLALPALAVFDERHFCATTNRGYGAGHNTVLAALRSDFHLVLNPDVTLQQDALCAALEALMAAPACVLLTPWVLDPSGQRQHVAKAMPGVLTLLARALPRVPPSLQDALGNARYELRAELTDQPVEGRFLAGGCFMLCRTPAWLAAGGFDERYFMYFEDFDASLRLCAGGNRVLYAPSVRIVHGGGRAAGKGLQHILWFARGALRFMSRHGWRLRA